MTWKAVTDKIVETLLPLRCYGCGDHLLGPERARGVCVRCRATVHPVTSPRCPQCGLPRERSGGGVDSRCGECLANRPAFDAVHACWIYDGAVSDALRRAKGSGDPSSLRMLARDLAPWLRRIAGDEGRARWVSSPADPRRIRTRGWDPARRLADDACGVGGFSIEWEAPLRRLPSGVKQARLGREERRRALKSAFRSTGPIEGGWAVFDDVMTTGATLDAIARELKRAGASRVVGVVAARVV